MAGRALLVDLYELTMAQSYLDEGIHDRPATFSLFARHLPAGWDYFVAAGLDDALRYLEQLTFEEDDIAYLEQTGLFTSAFLDHLRGLRFTGDVRALPEGTLFFPDEPVLEVTGPMLEAQLLETYVLNQVHLQSVIASKAARCVDVAGGRMLVDFGLRRTHGEDAGLKVARSSYLAGFDSTSNVLAGSRYGIPIAGTMAHSYIEAFAEELEAFRAYARSFPRNCTLLIDTYDTVEGARRAVTVAKELAERGYHLQGVRLDSGDLAELSRQVRSILDDAGFSNAMVFASGSLDEHEIEHLLETGAEIGGFGVGSKLGTAADSPYLDMVYKLVAFDGEPVLKLSKDKATWPAPKQVWRVSAVTGFAYDVIGVSDEPSPAGGRPQLETVMENGERVRVSTLDEARERCKSQRRLLRSRPYDVRFSEDLVALRDRVEESIRRRYGLEGAVTGLG